MTSTSHANVTNFQRLSQRAEQAGCSSDDLLARLLDQDTLLSDLQQQVREAQASETRYRLLTEMMSDYAMTTRVHDDGSLEFEWIVGAFEAMTGYSVEEAQQWPVAKLRHPDDHQRVAADVARTIKGETTVSEYRVRHRNGEYRWLRVRRKPVWDDEQKRVIRFHSAVSDITAQKRANELLELQKAALESTANAIVITDRNARILWVNPAFTRLTGYTLEEARGRNPNSLVKSGHHDQAFYKAMWDTILAGEVWFGKLVNRRKNGELYVEEQTITPVHSHAGDISHLIAIKQDVTARERDQQMQLDYERLKTSFRKEQEQNALIQQMIVSLSHDLRTPLSIISTTKDILSRYFDQLSEERRQEKFNSIGRHLQYVLELLDDTVQVIKSNLNHRAFRPSLVNLAALCQVSVEEVGRVNSGAHKLVFVNHAGIETVVVDEILVSRILLNLLSNAIKYSPEGSEVRLELDHYDNWLVLRVIDKGMGVREEDMPYLFDPFYRSASVTGISGTGLGLSIVNDCVERHQGRISVESVPEQGTTFTLELPKVTSISGLSL